MWFCWWYRFFDCYLVCCLFKMYISTSPQSFNPQLNYWDLFVCARIFKIFSFPNVVGYRKSSIILLYRLKFYKKDLPVLLS